jgi:uncharacterized membrane protein YfcA
MNAETGRDESVRARARITTRWVLCAWIAFAFIMLFGFVGYEYLHWFSLDIARVVFIVSVASLWGYIVFIKRRVKLNCVACAFDLFKFSHQIKNGAWRYCPRCAYATDAQPPQDKFDHASKRIPSLVAAYQIENAASTTRQRAVRWRNLMYFALGIFLLFMFIVMPGAFIGPWTKEIAAHWHWFVLVAFLPFSVWRIAAISRGLRCVHCAHKFDTDSVASLIASTKAEKHVWRFCPHCAQSLDTSKSVATSTRI